MFTGEKVKGGDFHAQTDGEVKHHQTLTTRADCVREFTGVDEMAGGRGDAGAREGRARDDAAATALVEERRMKEGVKRSSPGSV